MDLGKVLVAVSKTMEIMEPSTSTFDYPLIFSEATAAFRKHGFDTRGHAISAGVLQSHVYDRHRRLEAFAKVERGFHEWVESRHEWQQMCDVVTIGNGQDDREGNPICVGSDMVFGARSRTIYGVRPSFWPAPDSPDRRRIENHA